MTGADLTRASAAIPAVDGWPWWAVLAVLVVSNGYVWVRGWVAAVRDVSDFHKERR
ncbi:MAG: hypothetical protein JWQ18_92 [Conexibacter sp.]|nr:hypothetical protein [Conexibacter sp.]